MQVLHRRCAGLDVHKQTVVACARVMKGTRVRRFVQSFATTVPGLLELKSWLEQHRCRHVGMEATGDYWKPVWRILEADFTLILGNAHEIRNVPGRKSDVQDAEWLADLTAHGLIRPSLVPEQPQQELRDLTRTRTQLVREASRHAQRLQKTLEAGNIKLASVVSDVLGVSGRAILEGLADGITDVDRLIALKRTALKASDAQLRAALTGRLRDHHRFMLRLHLTQVDTLQAAIRKLDERIEEHLRPFRADIERLKTLPAAGEISASVFLAEAGLDVTRFPTAGHLVSWVGLCPRSDESAGKRRSTRIRRGNRWLKPVMIQIAWNAIKIKGSYHQQMYSRIRARRGAKKGIVAVAASLLTSWYYMQLRKTDYIEPQRPRISRDQAAARLLSRLRALGVEVEVKKAA